MKTLTDLEQPPGETFPALNPEQADLEMLMLGAPQKVRDLIKSSHISLEKLQILCHVRVWRNILDLGLGILSFIAAPFIYLYLPHPVTFGVCLLLAIRNFNFFSQLVHESIHGSLFQNTRWNNIAGNVCSYLLGYTLYGRQRSHLYHHLYLNTDRDPDITFTALNQPGRELFLSCLQDLLGISAIKRFLQYTPARFESDADRSWGMSHWSASREAVLRMLPILLVQGCVFALYAVTLGPWYYLWFHVLPIMTLYPLQFRIRAIAEHGLIEKFDQFEQFWMARTIHLTWIERFIMGPLEQHRHFEHHVFPFIPNRNLPSAHRLLRDAGVPVPIIRSYWGFVMCRIWKNWTTSAGDLRATPS